MQDKTHQRLAGKVAIVTGAGSGIGAATARRFAEEGARVVLAGRREMPLKATRETIECVGGDAIAIAADVSSPQDVDRLIAITAERFGQLDIVFNNAGIQGNGGHVTAMNEEDFDELIAINLKGPWLVTRSALKVMTGNGRGGVIVNTSSFLSTAATVGSSVYSASKAGLDAMIRAIALEVGELGIRINNVNPGVIDTPMLRAYGDDILPPLAARAALKRIGTPEDIANVVLWLCTDEARFVTGQSILADGGFTIPGPR